MQAHDRSNEGADAHGWPSRLPNDLPSLKRGAMPLHARYLPTDTIWDPSPVAPMALDAFVIRHLGPADGWSPGDPPVALIRGVGHPSHVHINGWPYLYVGTTDTGDALYETY